jgi:hypothetical protein
MKRRGILAKALDFIQDALERGMANYPTCGLVEDGYVFYDLTTLYFFIEDGGSPEAHRRPVRIVDYRRTLRGPAQ